MAEELKIRPGILIQNDTFPIATLYNKFIEFTTKNGPIPFADKLISIDFMQGVLDVWSGVNVHRNHIQHLDHRQLDIFRELAIFLQRTELASISDEGLTIPNAERLETESQHTSFINLYLEEAFARPGLKRPASHLEALGLVRAGDDTFGILYRDVMYRYYLEDVPTGNFRNDKIGMTEKQFYLYCLQPMEHAGVIDVLRLGKRQSQNNVRFCEYKFLPT